MFYSHEILTSTQYGVSTIWLVATIGPRSNTRRITRKAIQGVNIPRACDTIIEPGAPIALRLQGNLLYGVSRVYDQQCAYMLTDVEKVQSHMQTFYRVWGMSSIDPQAGKAKPNQLIIMDDPAFDLNFNLPNFRLDDDGNLYIDTEDDTQMIGSQMSPHTNKASSGSNGSPLGAFSLPDSPGGSFSQNLHQLEMPFGHDSILSQKPGDHHGLGNTAEEEQLVMDDDWGIQIDEHGNVVLANEPDLPQLSGPNSDSAAQDAHQDAPAAVGAEAEPGSDAMILDNPEDDVLLEGAEAFPQQQRQSDDAGFQPGSSSSASAPQQRQRKKHFITPDDETMLTRAQITAGHRDYLANQDAARKTVKPVTKAQARQYAFNLTFGFGIKQIGRPTPIRGLFHPLASMFAGPALQRSILGYSSADQPQPQDQDQDQDQEQPQGRRRTSAEAFGSEADGSPRRVRPRVDITPQVGRSQQEQEAQFRSDDNMPLFDLGDDEHGEVGREAPAPGSADSKISAPWNRSVGGGDRSSAHGSSVLKATGRQVSASPLHGRGSQQFPAIERFSDGPRHFGSDDFGGGGMGGGGDSSPSRGKGSKGSGSQSMRSALDQDGRNFLAFLERTAAMKGDRTGDGRHTWVDFRELFAEEQDRSKAIATQAFFFVLTLATRNLIRVEQGEPSDELQFGAIRVGVEVDEAEFFGEGVVVV